MGAASLSKSLASPWSVILHMKHSARVATPLKDDLSVRNWLADAVLQGVRCQFAGLCLSGQIPAPASCCYRLGANMVLPPAA